MKKLISILVAAVLLMSTLSVVVSAKTADIVHQSKAGTATVDGAKDDIYADGLILPIIQKGYSSSDGMLLDEATGTVYIVNDSENVYIYFEMYDSEIDAANAETWAQDSVEIFYMNNNQQVQVRYLPDGRVIGENLDNGHAIVLTEKGYDVEVAMPITDVLNNQIEMCIQNNACSGGARDYTVYIEGNSDADDAYQRSNRESVYDCWWTLTLAGDFEDTREVPPVEEEKVWTLDDETYATITEGGLGLIAMVYLQDTVNYGWMNLTPFTADFGTTMELYNANCQMSVILGEAETANFTKIPRFGIQIADNHFLQLPEDATVGTTGDSGNFGFEFTDVIITADGYADVVIPGEYVNVDWTIIQQNGYTSGNTYKIDFVQPAMDQLGLDLAGFCEYAKNISTISTNITLVDWNGITAEEVNAVKEAEKAEADAVVASIEEYITVVKNAVDAAELTDDVAELETLAETAKTAYENAVAKAEGYPDAEYEAAKLAKSVEKINEKIEEVKAELERIAAEEEAARIAAEEAAAKARTTTIIIVIAVVAVVAVALVIVLVIKKKK